ncbi:hypothetical protein, conserved [Leishmania tarentolae]|uniref:TATA element modulatory factor 1 TATA binding domain-containing protein n=1 Tax=Leishmania tarentolae TaxID=5689 RepID=A0A640KGP5_LEITA|nr:hypothetical protein, conserved [Leishmania tarentolae]
MWANFLDQIQQRIEDAVDLLGDEVAEDVAREDATCVAVATLAADLKGFVLPQQRMREQSVSSAENPDGEAGAEGREVDELSGLVIQSDLPEIGLRGLTPVATIAPAPPTLPLPSATPGLSAATPPPRHGILSDLTDVTSSSNASPQLVPDSQETGQQHPSASPSDTNPSIAGPPLKLHAEEVTMPNEELAAPPPVSTLSAKSLSLQGTDPPSALLHEEGTTAMTSHPTSVTSPGKCISSTSLPSSPLLPAEIDLSPPPPSAVVGDSSDIRQLLRFQKQLAEEMENAAKLQRQNASLKDRVSSLEEQLAGATSSLAHTAGSEPQISLLIERLGKEKERHKIVVDERNQLKEHLQDLEDEVEEYRAREEDWVSEQQQRQEKEIAARQRIAQLESEMRSCNAVVDNLRTQLETANHVNDTLQNQVEELKVSYSAQLDTVKESTSDTVDQLRQEVEQLRSSLQNLSIEYDTRTAELESEVQNANMHAHQAETRLSEMTLGSVNMLQDLRSELEDSQRSSATWKAEAQKMRQEYTTLLEQYAALKRSRAAAEADLRDRLSYESNTVSSLQKGIREWEDRYQALHESVGAMQAEIEEQRRTIMQLESTIQKRKASGAEVLSQSHGEVLVSTGAPPVKASFSEPSLPGSPFKEVLGGRLMSAPPLNPFMSMKRSPWSDSWDRKTCERLEQEVVRQSAELERVRAAATDAEVWKAKYNHLQEEHDLLLQLYGQLEDDVSALRKNNAGVLSADAAVASSAPGSVSAAAVP